MKKGKYILVLLLISVALTFSWYFFEKKPTEVTKSETEAFMRNISWGTNLESFTPYKKSDELEYVFITEKETENRANIDLSKLDTSLDISEILVNDIQTDRGNLDSISFEKILKITVRGKAKANNMTPSDIKNAIDLSFSQEGESQKESKEVQISKNIPEDIRFSHSYFSSNIDNLITVAGKNIESVDKIVVGEKSFAGTIKDGQFYFTLPKNTFGNGEYFVGVYLKNGKLIPASEKFSFTYNSNPINIAAITPNEIKNDEDRYVVLQGNGFNKMISLQLSNNLIFKNTLFTVVNDNVVSVKVPKWLKAWDYYFNMMDTAGIYEAKNILLRINQ